MAMRGRQRNIAIMRCQYLCAPRTVAAIIASAGIELKVSKNHQLASERELLKKPNQTKQLQQRRSSRQQQASKAGRVEAQKMRRRGTARAEAAAAKRTTACVQLCFGPFLRVVNLFLRIMYSFSFLFCFISLQLLLRSTLCRAAQLSTLAWLVSSR